MQRRQAVDSTPVSVLTQSLLNEKNAEIDELTAEVERLSTQVDRLKTNAETHHYQLSSSATVPSSLHAEVMIASFTLLLAYSFCLPRCCGCCANRLSASHMSCIESYKWLTMDVQPHFNLTFAIIALRCIKVGVVFRE